MSLRRAILSMLLAAGLLLAGMPAGARGGASFSQHATDLAELMDGLVRQGDETPQEAIDSLVELGSMNANTSPAAHRLMLLSIGVVAARNGRNAEAQAQIDALLGAHQPPDALAQGDAHLIRAELDVNAGHGEASYQEARAALQNYAGRCELGVAPPADCDYRAWWRALDLAQRGASGQGNTVVAASHAQAMLDVARHNGDRPREAISLAVSALLADENADAASANRLMAQARRLAHVDGSAWVEVGVEVYDGLLHHQRQQPEVTQHDYEAALAIAKEAGLKRPAMHLRANLSDVYIHESRPADAIAAIEAALPVARLHHDFRTERLLLHNDALAKLALGRLAEGKAELQHVLELWQRDTGPGQRQEALREFDDALTKAGDIAGALELFHREDALAREISAANRDAAEAEQRARYDQEAQKRRIELLERDNQLKSAHLGNQALARRLWTFAGAAMLLLGVLAMLMYLRMRELNRTLVRHETLLRAHSERDALTGLANRRQFREVMRVRGGERAFKGALLMVDIDHFKRINDRYGHASGDRVLVEVARRLGSAMRGDDLVARWGGEEFLVFAPDIAGEELDLLAERVRFAMSETPIGVDGGEWIAATVSIGYAAFPLPASHVPVTWEQAVNLADLSLYVAKNQGRNCAVGIVRTTAANDDALREVEADIARARQEGRVTMKISPPPSAQSLAQTALAGD